MSKPAPTRSVKEPYFSAREIARLAILVALSAVGGLIKIPSPLGSVAFDSAPAFLAAFAFSAEEGGIVGLLGHLISAVTAGFPLTVPVHLLVGIYMGLIMLITGQLARRRNIWVAAIAGIVLNGVGGALLMVPISGPMIFGIYVLPLTLGAVANTVVAVIVAQALKAAGLTPKKKHATRVHVEDHPSDAESNDPQ